MDNIPTGLSKSDDSLESDPTDPRVSTNIAVKFPKFYRTFMFSSFCPIDTIVIASSARPTFASLLIVYFHSFFAVFTFSTGWSKEISAVNVYL